MIGSLVTACIMLIMLSFIIVLPASICLYMALVYGSGFFVGMRAWRIYEHMIYVYERRYGLPLSLFSFSALFERLTGKAADDGADAPRAARGGSIASRASRERRRSTSQRLKARIC